MALMQQNRESSSMDRRKAELNEPGLNDVKDSGGPVQDSDVVLIYFYCTYYSCIYTSNVSVNVQIFCEVSNISS